MTRPMSIQSSDEDTELTAAEIKQLQDVVSMAVGQALGGMLMVTRFVQSEATFVTKLARNDTPEVFH